MSATEFVLSCSGASGSTTTRLNVEISADLARVLARIDPALSSEAASVISQVVSGVDSQPYGSAVTLPVLSPGARTLVLALDGGGEVFLAGFAAPGEEVQFNVASTARLLVLLALGSAHFEHITSAEVDSLITNSSHYPSLTAQITAAVNAGVSPLDVPDVRSRLMDLVADIAPTIAAREVSAVPSSKTRPPKFAKDLISLPYPIIGTGTEAGSVYVSGAGPGGATNVVNHSWIAWKARTQALSGGPYGEFKLLEAADTFSQALELPGPVAIPGGGVDSRLELYQDASTHTINVTKTFKATGALILELVLDEKSARTRCWAQGLGALVQTQASLIEFLAVNHAQDTPVEFLRGLVPAALGDTTDLAISCGFKADFGKIVLKGIAKQFGKVVSGYIGLIYAGYQIAQRIADITSIGGMVIQTIKYWGDTQILVICRAGDSIHPCVRGLRFQRSTYGVALGGNTLIVLEAIDEGGKVIAAPPPLSLVWSSSDPATIALDSSGSSVLNNVARAAKPGEVTVTVTDTASALTARTTVQVGFTKFRYESAPLEASGSVGGVPLPIPGPVIVEVTFDQPIIPGFSGRLSAENMINVSIRSDGVGTISGTGRQIDALKPQGESTDSAGYPIHVTFTNGVVTSWRMFTHGLQPYGSCSGGTNYIVMGTLNEVYQGRIYREDGSFAECDSSDDSRNIYITGRHLAPDPARWVAVP
jgi:hypothetical protein